MLIGVSGFGRAGETRLESYRSIPDVEVVAVADPTPARRARAVSSESVPAYSSLEELLRACRPDVVDVCSPPAWHARDAAAALRAGCHVICEKPVATTLDDVRDLVRLGAEADRLLYPAHNYLYSPMMRVLHDAVAEETVGTLEAAEFRILRPGHARGVPEWQPDWRRRREIAGGGILLDHGTHCIYMATQLLGGPPRRVACTIEYGGGSSPVDEATTLDLDFGPVVAHVVLSWASDRRSNLYALRGRKGSVEVEDGSVTVRGRPAAATFPSPTFDSRHRDWFGAMFADFVAALADRPRWAELATEAVATMQVVERAYASAASGGAWLELGGHGSRPESSTERPLEQGSFLDEALAPRRALVRGEVVADDPALGGG